MITYIKGSVGLASSGIAWIAATIQDIEQGSRTIVGLIAIVTAAAMCGCVMLDLYKKWRHRKE